MPLLYFHLKLRKELRNTYFDELFGELQAKMGQEYQFGAQKKLKYTVAIIQHT